MLDEWEKIETRKARAFRSFVSGCPHSRCSDVVAFSEWRELIWWRRSMLFDSYKAAKLSGKAAWAVYQSIDLMIVSPVGWCEEKT